MLCSRCKADLPDGANFCPGCGLRTVKPTRKPRTSPNGVGCAYQRPGYKTWTASVVVGYRPLPPLDPDHPENKRQRVPIKKTKGGFKTKKEALAYCAILKNTKSSKKLTLQQLYDEWEPWYSPRVIPETMNCYRAAYNHFSALHFWKVSDITAGDLQRCLDECPAGHRTHQMMKTIAGLLWKYAVDHEYAVRNMAANLYIGKGASVKREPLTELEVEKIRQSIPHETYAPYVYALCYLGFRPGELLEIRKEQVSEQDGRLYIREGKKTAAGKNRIVPVHQKIEWIIRERMETEGTDFLFPQRIISKKGEFKGYKEMTCKYFSKSVFKPLLARLGLDTSKVPYSARHTFSDKLKHADGDSMDKARLIGHTDYSFTQEKYQSTSVRELTDIIDSIV